MPPPQHFYMCHASWGLCSCRIDKFALSILLSMFESTEGSIMNNHSPSLGVRILEI